MIDKITLPSKQQALPGRTEPMPVPEAHFINGHRLQEPFPDNMQKAMFGMGCFWGAEHSFWQLAGVYSTAVGYSAGITPNPSYQEVCTGMTGHNEAVLVVFDLSLISYSQLLKCFWESHNPTQGMRQGNDRGTQYRSGIYTFNQMQQDEAEQSKLQVESLLNHAGFGHISTEILSAQPFYYAEEYHQQYLAKNPNGYCGLGGTGILFEAV